MNHKFGLYYATTMLNKESLITGLLVCLFVVSAGLTVLNQAPTVGKKVTATTSVEDGIGVLNIYGPIAFSEPADVWSSGQDADSILAQIAELSENTHVRAIVLRINSPGGTVGASQEIFSALARVKAKRNIPIVASIADMGASGAYWIALSADTIYANPGSLVGSIGVLVQQWDLSQVKDRYGVGLVIHKSGAYKDMLSGWRKNKPEEQAMIEGTLEEIHGQFRQAVAENREIPTDNILSLAQGQVFSGSQALRVGLVDKLGGFDDAVRAAGRQTQLGDQPNLIYPGDAGLPRWITQLRRQFHVQGLVPSLLQNSLQIW